MAMVPPTSSRARDVGYRDRDLAIRISKEANSLGPPLTFYIGRTKTRDPNLTGSYAHLPHKELDRKHERARSSSMGLSGSQYVGPRDLALALRISKEVNSTGARRSDFTYSAPKLKIRILQEITRTCAERNWVGRSKERDLALLIPPFVGP